MNGTRLPTLPTFEDCVRAHEKSAAFIAPTPTLPLGAGDAVGANLWLKCENLHPIGAFKLRGAHNAISRLPEQTLRKGLLTYSSGNHGQAVAYVAQALKTTAKIFMPEDAPQSKVAAIKRWGGEVIFAGKILDDRRAAAQKAAAKTGAAIIEPFDDAAIIAGQAGATLELFQQLEARNVRLDALLVPVGGGGLIAGACLVARHFGVPVFAVEPQGCDSMRVSLNAGYPVRVEPAASWADGLRGSQVGQLNFAIAKQVVVDAFTVDDDDLRRAVKFLAWAAKLVVEPSGAATTAFLLKNPSDLRFRGKSVGTIVSGGNIDGDRLVQCLTSGQP